MDKHIEELLPFYALEALTDDERELVEKYLAEHPEARQQAEEMSKTASALPQAIPPVEPAPHVKQALLRRVASDAEARPRSSVQSQPSRRGLRFESLFRTFSLVTAAVAIIWVIILSLQVSRLQNEVSSLNERLVAQSQSLE